MNTQSFSAYHPAFYPVNEPVAMIVGSVRAFSAKRRAAKDAEDARNASRFTKKASDRNAAADIPVPRPMVASMREFLGMSPALPMRQVLGLVQGHPTLI